MKTSDCTYSMKMLAIKLIMAALVPHFSDLAAREVSARLDQTM